MYTIDYDINTNRFQALFLHGTSSENINSILQNGIVRPAYDNVVDLFLTGNAQIDDLINQNINKIMNGPLGVIERSKENDVAFATWFGNQVSLKMLSDEVGRIARHGGEMYARTWTNISALLKENDLAVLPYRYPTAVPTIAFFQVPFDLLMQEIPNPQAKYEFIEELSWALYEGGMEPYKYLMEVKFLNNLPNNRIIWHGSVQEAADQLSSDLISPVARRALLDQDDFMDLNPKLKRPRRRM